MYTATREMSIEMEEKALSWLDEGREWSGGDIQEKGRTQNSEGLGGMVAGSRKSGLSGTPI